LRFLTMLKPRIPLGSDYFRTSAQKRELMKIERFEDIEALQLALELAHKVNERREP
jgi:hypothetical protein